MKRELRERASRLAAVDSGRARVPGISGCRSRAAAGADERGVGVPCDVDVAMKSGKSSVWAKIERARARLDKAAKKARRPRGAPPGQGDAGAPGAAAAAAGARPTMIGRATIARSIALRQVVGLELAMLADGLDAAELERPKQARAAVLALARELHPAVIRPARRRPADERERGALPSGRGHARRRG
jgi:hypothetical protein